MVSRDTPALTSSVACACRSWWIEGLHLRFLPVLGPQLLRGGISQRAADVVLLRPEQRSVPVAAYLQVAPQRGDQGRVVEQDGAPSAAFA